MRRSEGLIGGIVFIIATLLALMLSGCDGMIQLSEDVRKVDAQHRAEAFSECAALCGSRPVEVRFDRNYELSQCRCDIVISTDAEVE
jgi:hypothetical protein